MAKYPGFSILYEVGSRKELAQSYGVSERTIYRWLNKARAETGAKKDRPRRPRQSTLENFQGTRKELAKKYGVSERTVYRWLNKARKQGADITSRAKASAYPGINILDEQGSNRQIAKKYNVTESTIRRWKKRAAAGMPEEIFTEDQLPQEVFTEDQLPREVFTEDQLPEEIIIEEPGSEEQEYEEPGSEEPKSAEEEIINLLFNNDQILEDSIFRQFSPIKQQEYISSYIRYQYEMDPGQFYNSNIHDFDFTPDFVSTINMWGDEFETWLTRMEELDDFGSDWVDSIGL